MIIDDVWLENKCRGSVGHVVQWGAPKINAKIFKGNILYLQGVEVILQNDEQPKYHQTIRMMNSKLVKNSETVK